MSQQRDSVELNVATATATATMHRVDYTHWRLEQAQHWH